MTGRGRSGIAPVRNGFTGEPAAHEADPRDTDHAFRTVRVGFVVAGQGQEEAEGVDADVALAARNLLGCVATLACGRDAGGRLDALGVQHAGRRLGLPPLGFAHQSAEEAVELVEYAVVLPCREVPIDGFPRCLVVGQVAPGDAGAVDVEDRVHDPAKVMFGWTSDVQALPSPPGAPGRQNRFRQAPPGIGQVTRIRPLSLAHVSVPPVVGTSRQGANGAERGRPVRRRIAWSVVGR